MTKGCYTCRRRRIICDNGQPTCRKCRDAGKECLGYQKPLVWVKGGVASRGKMMGRSFDDAEKSMKKSRDRPSEPEPEPEPETTHGSSASNNTDLLLASESPDTISPSSSYQKSPEADAWIQESLDMLEAEEIGPTEASIYPGPANNLEAHGQLVQVSRNHPFDYVPAPWGLVDPTMKDFSPLTRFYLSHYNQCITNELLVYPQTKNPWRDIMALVGYSPLITNTLCAMGAVHYSLMSSSDPSVLPWSSHNPLTADSLLSTEEIENMILPSNSRRPPSRAYQDFLEFKQRTLSELSRDLMNPATQNDDINLAAIVLLALLDVFESGSGAWSYHIEGLKKLLRDRPGNKIGRGILQGLEEFAIEGCVIMEIMGSTLARPGALSRPFLPASGASMLKRLEETSWVGCPAFLLEVIFFIHTLWYPESEILSSTPRPATLSTTMQHGQPLTRESFAALLHSIRTFDPVSWSHEMQAYFYLDDLSSRIALASAYQAAVYLYTSRVLSRAREGFSPPWKEINLPDDHSIIANDLIARICSIPRSDPHFKCLIWPTFIAGVECRRLAQRALVLEQLGALYKAVTSVNVRNAAWVLRLMWQKQDLRRRENMLFAIVDDQDTDVSGGQADEETFDSSFDWVDELDASRLDWLFI
ncbi:Protein of unknown function DUF3468 [Penicillium chermesinum]|uniref:Zn(2)-C6 fungal-type domain-containing protein n=1 Tax=Penicillium chermesinum TaxID=63820 RepID=A0A9W9P8U8_9EURO|nr:Protein of unknown function DUF3468 [Penicillium chermesinum]KAJ5239969.1 Protein of unknown function DUF3468 [Penicillium chermesinum]